MHRLAVGVPIDHQGPKNEGKRPLIERVCPFLSGSCRGQTPTSCQGQTPHLARPLHLARARPHILPDPTSCQTPHLARHLEPCWTWKASSQGTHVPNIYSDKWLKRSHTNFDWCKWWKLIIIIKHWVFLFHYSIWPSEVLFYLINSSYKRAKLYCGWKLSSQCYSDISFLYTLDPPLDKRTIL